MVISSIKQLNYSGSDRGSAIVELSITLVFLVIMFAGLSSIGRALSFSSRLYNASFYVTLSGSEANKTVGADSMNGTKQNFDYLFQKGLNQVNLQSAYKEEPSTGAMVPLVETTLSSNTIASSSILKAVDVGASLVAYHMNDKLDQLSQLNNFDLLQHQHYDCDGNPCISGYNCPSLPCGASLDVPTLFDDIMH